MKVVCEKGVRGYMDKQGETELNDTDPSGYY